MKKKSIMAVLLAMSMIASAACSSKEEKKSKKDKKSDKESAETLDDEDEEETEKKQKATESEEAASTTEAAESEKEASTTEATEPEKETEKETEAVVETEPEETMPANPANLQFIKDESVRPHISGPATYAVGDYIDLERPDYDVERIVGIRDGEVMTNYDVSNRCKILYDNQTYYEVAPAGGWLYFTGSFDYHGTQYQYDLKLYPHISDPVFFQRKTGIEEKEGL